MLSSTALGVPRFSMTSDRRSWSTRRNSLPKLARARSAETTMVSFLSVRSMGNNSSVHVLNSTVECASVKLGFADCARPRRGRVRGIIWDRGAARTGRSAPRWPILTPQKNGALGEIQYDFRLIIGEREITVFRPPLLGAGRMLSVKHDCFKPHNLLYVLKKEAREGRSGAKSADPLDRRDQAAACADPRRDRGAAGDCARSGRAREPSLHRILYRQYPQPQHAHGLRARGKAVLRLVRRAPPRTSRDRSNHGRGVHRAARQPGVQADRQTAPGGHQAAVRLPDHWRNSGGQPSGLGARAEVRGETGQDAGAGGRGGAQAARFN